MRVTQRHLAVFLGMTFGAACALGFGACIDAVHLDPTSSGSGGSMTHGEAGADVKPPPQECRSNPECAFPEPICDTVSGMCVECLVLSDCARKPGTVCSLGACICPNPDGSLAPLTFCGGGATPSCIDIATSQANCGGCGMVCKGMCADKKCSVPMPVSDAGEAGAPTCKPDAGEDAGCDAD